MKLTPELISYLPYIPEGKVVGSFNGHLVRITANQTYVNSNRYFGSYESPYCLEAENFYIKTLEDIKNKNDQLVNGSAIRDTVIPLVSEDCTVFDPTNGEISNLEVLSKVDRIPSTLVSDIGGRNFFIGSPRIIARTGPTEDRPVFLRTIEDGYKEIQNTGIRSGLINFDNIPFVKPIICLIRKTEEESNPQLNALFSLCGDIISEQGLLKLRKSWGDHHLEV